MTAFSFGVGALGGGCARSVEPGIGRERDAQEQREVLSAFGFGHGIGDLARSVVDAAIDDPLAFEGMLGAMDGQSMLMKEPSQPHRHGMFFLVGVHRYMRYTVFHDRFSL
jgi:hypothetical protein